MCFFLLSYSQPRFPVLCCILASCLSFLFTLPLLVYCAVIYDPFHPPYSPLCPYIVSVFLCPHSGVVFVLPCVLCVPIMMFCEAFIEKWFITQSFPTQSSLLTSAGQKYEEQFESTAYNELLCHDWLLCRASG